MLGIEMKYECTSCGNIISGTSPFWTKDFRKKIQEPKACGCGNKTNFQLLSFKQCEYTVIPEGHEVVKMEEFNNENQK